MGTFSDVRADRDRTVEGGGAVNRPIEFGEELATRCMKVLVVGEVATKIVGLRDRFDSAEGSSRAVDVADCNRPVQREDCSWLPAEHHVVEPQRRPPGSRAESTSRSWSTNGIRASRILVLALVNRPVIIDPDTKKARAICAVESPATARRVNATCDSGANAG
jgi:hypothetical protein